MRRDELLLLMEHMEQMMEIPRKLEELSAEPQTEGEKTNDDEIKLLRSNLVKLKTLIANIGIRSLWPAETRYVFANTRGAIGGGGEGRPPFHEQRFNLLLGKLTNLFSHFDEFANFCYSVFSLHGKGLGVGESESCANTVWK